MTDTYAALRAAATQAIRIAINVDRSTIPVNPQTILTLLAERDRKISELSALYSDLAAAEQRVRELEAAAVGSPRFREAVQSVFDAPGEWGPAKGVLHFIDMLAAALAAQEPSDE